MQNTPYFPTPFPIWIKRRKGKMVGNYRLTKLISNLEGLRGSPRIEVSGLIPTLATSHHMLGPHCPSHKHHHTNHHPHSQQSSLHSLHLLSSESLHTPIVLSPPSAPPLWDSVCSSILFHHLNGVYIQREGGGKLIEGVPFIMSDKVKVNCIASPVR